jgi:hypothetical protein
VTFAAFVSLLPLLVVGVAVIGYVSAASSKDLAQEVIKELRLSGAAADALIGALGFELLKVIGSVWVPKAVASSSALYGSWSRWCCGRTATAP